MVDRRRISRSLNNVPETELELMWEISSTLGELENTVKAHLKEHAESKKMRAATRSLVWTNTFVLISIIASVILHYLPAK